MTTFCPNPIQLKEDNFNGEVLGSKELSQVAKDHYFLMLFFELHSRTKELIESKTWADIRWIPKHLGTKLRSTVFKVVKPVCGHVEISAAASAKKERCALFEVKALDTIVSPESLQALNVAVKKHLKADIYFNQLQTTTLGGTMKLSATCMFILPAGKNCSISLFYEQEKKQSVIFTVVSNAVVDAFVVRFQKMTLDVFVTAMTSYRVSQRCERIFTEFFSNISFISNFMQGFSQIEENEPIVENVEKTFKITQQSKEHPYGPKCMECKNCLNRKRNQMCVERKRRKEQAELEFEMQRKADEDTNDEEDRPSKRMRVNEDQTAIEVAMEQQQQEEVVEGPAGPNGTPPSLIADQEQEESKSAEI